MISSKNAARKGQYAKAWQTDGLKAVGGLGLRMSLSVVGAERLRLLAGSDRHGKVSSIASKALKLREVRG